MSSNAPAQLLGYAVQFPRALLHLLKGGPGDAVSVELLGDVATHKVDSTVLTEEDKTSTVGNPVTNRSTDLWKTFYNWLVAVQEGNIDLSKTKFFIYTNQSGREAIVNTFDKASTVEEARAAIASAKSDLNDIGAGHEIWPYYSYVMSSNQDVLAELISRFELQVDGGLGFSEIKYELERLLINKNQHDFVSQELNGWLQEQIMTKISLGTPAIIYWHDYKKQFSLLFERARKLELIDFALQTPPTASAIENQVATQPCYLRHLNHIKADEDEIIEAVTDYLRAKVNRDQWIENEIIDEVIAKDFEDRLTKFWTTAQKTVKLTEHTRPEHEQGKMVFYQCKIRQEPIRDMTPPAGTIAGSYHALVETQSLGWHPRWETL